MQRDFVYPSAGKRCWCGVTTRRSAMTKRKRSKAAPRPRTAQRRTAKKGPGQLVITLAAANGEIAKIEILEPAGSRRTVSETEFARLLGDNSEMDEICEAIAVA